MALSIRELRRSSIALWSSWKELARTAGLALAVSVLGIAGLALGQQTQPTTELSEQIDLARLVDLAAKRLRLNIQYDAKQLQGQLTLRLGAGVSDEELWTLTNRMLAAAGFTSVQMAGEETLSIVKLADAGSLARVEADLERARAGYVRFLRPLRHRATKEVLESVGLVLSKPGGSSAAVGTTRILLSDLKPQVRQALALIDLLDVPGSPAPPEEIEIRHGKATDLVTLVERVSTTQATVGAEAHAGKLLATADDRRVLLLCPESERPYWRGLIAQLDRAEEVRTETYTPRSFGVHEVARLIEDAVRSAAADTLRVVVDDLSGSLIVTARASTHREIAQLLERLEAAGGGSRRRMRTFSIVNRDVAEVVDVLERLIESGALEGAVSSAGATASAPSSGGAPPVVGKPAAPTKAGGSAEASSSAFGLTLTADRGTNTLIAIGEGRLLEQLERLLATVDVREPQVLLEATVVTLTDNDIVSLGVELQGLPVDAETKLRLVSLFGLGSPPLSGPLPPPSAAGGFGGVVLNPGDYSALVVALETINRGRSLTSPKVLVSNHQEASLTSVLQAPYQTVNASTTVATTAYGGSLDAGTVLTVRPQITEADQLRLDYSVTLSAFTGPSASPNLPPPRQQSSLKSQVTIPDGYTVVVGGLESESVAEAISQVPIVGDIPLLGLLFKSTTTTKQRSKTYVFLRASIQRDALLEGLKLRSDGAAAELGLDPSDPVVEPRLLR